MPLFQANIISPLGLAAHIGKVFVGIVGLLYAVGFLVVTFHLGAFGISPVTWLRPQYLLAGIWCVLPALSVVCGLAFLAVGLLEPWARRNSLEAPRRMRIYRHVMGGVQGVALALCVLGLQSAAISYVVHPSSNHFPKWWNSGSVIALKLSFYSLALIVCFGIVVFCLYGAMAIERLRADQRMFAISVGIMGLVFFICSTVAYVQYFSATVYSAIPSTWGGGKPQVVVFLIDPERRSSPLVLDNSGMRSIPYKLLLVTDSDYVVQSPSRSELALQFKQNAVRGMIVLR